MLIIIIYYIYLHPEFFSTLDQLQVNTKRSRIKSFVYLRIE